MLKRMLRAAVEQVPKPLTARIPVGMRAAINGAIGRGVAEPPPTPPDLLPREITDIQWLHRIDLGKGITTPGRDDSSVRLHHLQMPESLAGMSVLDVGAWDGYFSFAAERRGAKRVLATDSRVWSGAGWGSKAGFDLAKRMLSSQVEAKQIDVMDLSPQAVGVFDLVLFLGVIYHMRDPLTALERAASVTSGMLILESEVIFTRDERPTFYFYPGYADDHSNFWIPSAKGLEAMLRSVGFKEVKTVSTRIDTRRNAAGRIFIHAMK